MARVQKKSGLKTKKAPALPSVRDRHMGPFRVAAVWPHDEAPLILTQIGRQQTFIATTFSPITFSAIENLKFSTPLRHEQAAIAAGLPRWIFVLPYDAFGKQTTDKFCAGERILAWEIYAGLIWDQGQLEPRYVATDACKLARFHLPFKPKLTKILAEAMDYISRSPQRLNLRPSTSDETYLDTVQRIINDIQLGSFYQINLLRYFRTEDALGWQNLCSLMEDHAAPETTLITQGRRVIASLSPERFIDTTPYNDAKEGASTTTIKTWPIKGTAPRFESDLLKDQQSGELLSCSPKDRAELRMIIDLMRNDLTQVCLPGSVKVEQDGALRQFSHVWHLEGEISGRLNPDINLMTLLKSVCPGGSITGAPKVAAMKRIDADEGQRRGYFMGHAFRLNYDGSLQSNVLIRTLVSDNLMQSARYAAGSGIVIKSDPRSELEEVRAKCAVVALDHRPNNA